MTIADTALKAAQGQDTEDFLHHIAWQEVLLPKLLRTKEQLTRDLVGAVLTTPAPNAPSKEQLAGRIQGIDYIISEISKLVKEGRSAQETLKSNNISLK